MRSLSRFAALFLILLLSIGCDVEQVLEQIPEPQSTAKVEQSVEPIPAATDTEQASTNNLRIASFNIQVFGQSKLGKPEVMQILAETIRRFDVVAIQEIRSKDQSLLPTFLEMINATGRKYHFILGPRLGRTISKEQYAFVYDTERVEADRNSIYTADDPQDLLHREPLVTRFRAITPVPEKAFTFTLVNIHTDPDETDQELNALDDVFRSVLQRSGEDDVIVLGDLNVDEENLGELGQLPGIRYVVSGVPTNTRGTKTYDNIVFGDRYTNEYTGRWGVFDLMRQYQLTREQALDVSDHLPVWAEFFPYENAGAEVAAQPESVVQ
jgi:endonuclease/exonuclease/phosphatase family metal-dependent hydrolase